MDGLDQGQVVEEDVCVENKQRGRRYRDGCHGEDIAQWDTAEFGGLGKITRS
jgi:hypothetical protein